jgi:SAM-dependent methyltransferase
MKNHVNITAYEGVESHSTFNEITFKKYCKNKISECDKHISFIKQFVNKECIGTILEVGSGNGKFLYALERDGFLTEGVGYELSNSRVTFANKFSRLVESKKVKNICGDFVDQYIESDSVNLVIAVDLVIQLISATSDQSEMDFLKKVYSALKPGGSLLLELMDFSSLIKMYKLNDNNLQLWKEFDMSDPWQYGLDDFTVDGENIAWDKRFIGRDKKMSDTSFSNVLRHYTFETIRDKLCSVGFKDGSIKKYDYWEMKGDTLKDEFIVLAVKE